MFGKFQLITLVLLGTAIAAPVGRAGVNPLAQSILRTRGLSASEVKAGTTDVCSRPTPPASCYSTARGSGVSAGPPERIGGSPYPQLRSGEGAVSGGFDWEDAGIGAAFVAGLGILGVVGLLAIRRRHKLAQLDV